MSKHIPFIVVFTALITACGVDDNSKTSSTSQGIGDPYCWDEWGEPIYFDEFEVGIETINDCYSWDDPGGGGGGGGGGDTSCSSPETYYGVGTGYADDEASAQQAADQAARTQSQTRCLNSAYICTAHASSTTSSSNGCSYTETPGYYHYHCTSTAQTNCTYTWW